MADRKWSFKLRFFAVVNFVLGFIAAIVQIVIFSQGRDSHAKVGAGIWAGILFGIVGVALWVVSVKGSRNSIIFITTLIATVLAIVASIAMIAVSASIIHEETDNPLIQDKRLLDAIHSAASPRIDDRVEEKHPVVTFLDTVREHGTKVVQKVANKLQHELCNTFLDNNCRSRIALESVLLACGVIAFIVNVFAACTQVMMINDPVTMA